MKNAFNKYFTNSFCFFNILFTVSCQSISIDKIHSNINNYKEIFSYIEKNHFQDKSIYDNLHGKCYEDFGNLKIFEIKDINLINYMKNNKISIIYIVTFKNNAQNSPKIVLELDSKPFIQKRTFIVKYLTDKIDENNHPINLDGNIYYYKWKANTY